MYCILRGTYKNDSKDQKCTVLILYNGNRKKNDMMKSLISVPTLSCSKLSMSLISLSGIIYNGAFSFVHGLVIFPNSCPWNQMLLL